MNRHQWPLQDQRLLLRKSLTSHPEAKSLLLATTANHRGWRRSKSNHRPQHITWPAIAKMVLDPVWPRPSKRTCRTGSKFRALHDFRNRGWSDDLVLWPNTDMFSKYHSEFGCQLERPRWNIDISFGLQKKISIYLWNWKTISTYYVKYYFTSVVSVKCFFFNFTKKCWYKYR